MPVAAALVVLLCGCLVAWAEIPAGSLHGHFSLAETEAWLNATAKEFPRQTLLFSIGESIERRSLWTLCVGYECHVPGSKAPEALYTALHHAREPMGLTALLIFIDDILRPKAASAISSDFLLRSRRLYFVLIVNPDGYKLNEIEPGMQRKNVRKSPAGTKCPMARETAQDGVDLNRNYDFCFHRDNVGSSTKPCDVDFEGPAPFSEPETQAMKRLVEAHKFHVAFNYHSFGRQVLIPYSCKPEGKTHDEAFIDHYAKRLVRENRYPYGQAWRSNLYSVNGDASDWMYHFHGIVAVSPEVSPPDPVASEHDGFWVSPPSKVRGYAMETLAMNYVGAWTAGVWLELSGFKLSGGGGGGGGGGELEFTLANEGMEPVVGGQVHVVFMSAGNRTDLGPLDAPGPRGVAPLSLRVRGIGASSPGALMAYDASSCTTYDVNAGGQATWRDLRAACPEALVAASSTPAPSAATHAGGHTAAPSSATTAPSSAGSSASGGTKPINMGGVALLVFCMALVVCIVAYRRRRRWEALSRDDVRGGDDEEERQGLV